MPSEVTADDRETLYQSMIDLCAWSISDYDDPVEAIVNAVSEATNQHGLTTEQADVVFVKLSLAFDQMVTHR